MVFMTLAIFFISGLIIGSFLNVVIYRINLAESILGRSHCPYCKAEIKWHDNIPLLSFILLRARCRECGEKISWQYPLVELFAGIIFTLTAYCFFSPHNYASWIETAMYLGVFSLLLVIFVYDMKYMEIPMIIIWLGVFWAVLCFLFLDGMEFRTVSHFLSLKIVSGIAGGAASFAFFFSLAYFSREKWMGAGDAYLAMLLGLLVGWPKIIFLLTLAFFIGAVYAIMLVALGKKSMKSQVPFAPFMVIGTFLAVFLEKLFPDLVYWIWYL